MHGKAHTDVKPSISSIASLSQLHISYPIHTRTHKHTHTYTHSHTLIHTHTQTKTQAHTRTHTLSHTHTHTHTSSHTQAHTHTKILPFQPYTCIGSLGPASHHSPHPSAPAALPPTSKQIVAGLPSRTGIMLYHDTVRLLLLKPSSCGVWCMVYMCV